jgi:RHS repeat-associated protein
MIQNDYNQLGVQADLNANFDYWLNDAINQDEYEGMIFFYHKDLPKAFGMGSSTQISDPGANIIQHIEYLPYGETFFERRDIWNTPYKFNAKELDQETGLYYYGARYYTPEVSIWLSVDPLAGEYPSLSPYAYCGGNPIKYIDPDGNWFTEPERRKAIERAYEHVANRSKYQHGGRFNPPGGRNDCAGLMVELMVYAGIPKNQVYGPGIKGVYNTVSAIVSGNKEILDYNKMEEGNFVTFKTSRSDSQGPNGKYDHIGIITSIERDEDGNVTSFNFIHSSSKAGANEMTYDFTKKRHTKWGNKKLLLTGIYKWDNEPILLPMIEIFDKGNVMKMESIKPYYNSIPEKL